MLKHNLFHSIGADNVDELDMPSKLVKVAEASQANTDLDQYSASNYKPSLSDEERKLAEAKLDNAGIVLSESDLKALYIATRILQRHSIDEIPQKTFYVWMFYC